MYHHDTTSCFSPPLESSTAQRARAGVTWRKRSKRMSREGHVRSGGSLITWANHEQSQENISGFRLWSQMRICYGFILSCSDCNSALGQTAHFPKCKMGCYGNLFIAAYSGYSFSKVRRRKFECSIADRSDNMCYFHKWFYASEVWGLTVICIV